MSLEVSESVDKLLPALIKVQTETRNLKKTEENPHFRSKYSSLTEVLDAIKLPLTNNKFALIQAPGTTTEGDVIVTTMLIHESGQWIKSALQLRPERNGHPQAVGSAITYAKRYSLIAMLALGEDDDDGNAACTGRTNRVNTTSQSQPIKVRPNHSDTDKKTKVIFSKENPAFVKKVSDIIANKGALSYLNWIISYLDGKEMKEGMVDEALELAVKNSSEK